MEGAVFAQPASMRTPSLAVRGRSAGLWVVVWLISACGSSASRPGGQGGSPVAGSGGAGGQGGVGGGGGAPGAGGAPTGGSAAGGSGGTGGGAGDTGPRPADAGAAPADAGLGPGAPPPAAPGECARLLGGPGPASQWVSWDAQGKLVYKTLDAGGDRIMDFSFAGYHGGGVALPDVPVQVMLGPSGGDDTAAIQGAIDEVSKRPLAGGFRGAVLLQPGTFQSATTVTISASGVVLRGSGPGMGGTEIQLTGTPHRFLVFQGSGTKMVEAASKTGIVDDFVPAGATRFTVESAAGFKVGDEVLVGRPVTAEWVSFMGMDTLVRNGQPQTWIRPGTVVNAERVITAIAGNKVTVNIPLSDSLDGKHVKPPGGSMTRFSFPRTSEIGVEHLRVVGQPRAEMVDFNFLAINTVVDGWVRDVVAHDVTAGVTANGDAKRITIEDTTISHTMVDFVSAAKPSDFN